MKKPFIYTICIALLVSSFVAAQKNDANVNTTTTDGRTSQRLFKVHNNPTQDKTDQFEVQGIGGTIFTAANTVDGTANSYIHSPKITVALLPMNNKNGSFQLVFYSPSEKLTQAATYSDGVLNIYYPISFYEGIKEKLNQAIAAKKKVYIKVIQKTDGYREGSLIF